MWTVDGPNEELQRLFDVVVLDGRAIGYADEDVAADNAWAISIDRLYETVGSASNGWRISVTLNGIDADGINGGVVLRLIWL